MKKIMILDLFQKDQMWKVSSELCRYVCSDMWYFVWHSQCWTCFGGMRYYRSHGGPRAISCHLRLNSQTAFIVLFTSKWLHTTCLQPFVTNNGAYRTEQYINIQYVLSLIHIQCNAVKIMIQVEGRNMCHNDAFVIMNLDLKWRFHTGMFYKCDHVNSTVLNSSLNCLIWQISYTA